MTTKGLLTAMAAVTLIPSSMADVYTLPDFTRTAGESSNNDVHFNFDPNSGWSGTPPNEILNEESVYLKFTVTWDPSADIGTFNVRFNVNDNGSAGRISAGTEGSGFALVNGNGTGDGDGPGPATAKPSVDAVDTTAQTSVTFVLKADQTAPSPGGDWWFADTTQQDGAGHFLYINPDLGSNESLQSTKWAAWRSGQNGYESVTFRTNTNAVDLVFSDIALYTGEDTPFSTAVGAVDAGTSTVEAAPTSLPADGVSTSIITVTLKDASGVPISDTLVSLANTAGPGTPTIDPADTGSDTTDFFGVATFAVTSTTVGSEEFTATADSVTLTQTASVDFTSTLTDAGTSTVAVSPATIPADGNTESFITVTLRNASGLPLPGKQVSLANTSGPGTPDISPAESGSDTTDADGEATFRVRSTTIGLEEFTATCDTDAVTLVADAVNVDFVAADASALLAYEGFDYDLGLLAGLDGGVGFAAGWVSPESSFVGEIFDETGSLYTTWDGVYTGGVSMSSPPRYLATRDTQSNPQVTANRTLASDAGTLAGNDNVLWMGAVFHYEQVQGSAFVNLGLVSDGYITDRGRRLSTAGMDFMGVSNWAQPNNNWNTRLNATIVEDHVTGTGYAGPYVQSLGSVNPAAGDMFVVLKYTFGTSDRVEAAFFTEGEIPTEAAFYTHPTYVSAVYSDDIDESQLSTITYNQQRGENALDEIRVGSAFSDLLGLGLITTFEAAGAAGVIDQTAKTIDVEVPFGTNLSTLAPTFNLSSGTCDQTSGAVPTPDFGTSNPVTYTVTDTSTDPDTINAYTVTVTEGPKPPATLTIDLGDPGSGTTIESGQFIGSGPTNLPLPALPPGSILRSITYNGVTLDATDSGSDGNFTSDLTVLLDPTPGAPGSDFVLGITSTGANVTFDVTGQTLEWSGGGGGVGTAMTETKTDADWATAGDIDLATTGLFLGNAYQGTGWVSPQGGTWSGTITLEYDDVGTSTPYESWAGGALFEGDENGDGVSNGVAWLLGAADPNADALGLLPTVTEQNDGDLILTFNCLAGPDRGAALLEVEYDADLAGAWTGTPVPGVVGNSTVGNVSFVVTDPAPAGGLLNVVATIDADAAANGRLFGRLEGEE